MGFDLDAASERIAAQFRRVFDSLPPLDGAALCISDHCLRAEMGIGLGWFAYFPSLRFALVSLTIGVPGLVWWTGPSRTLLMVCDFMNRLRSLLLAGNAKLTAIWHLDFGDDEDGDNFKETDDEYVVS